MMDHCRVVQCRSNTELHSGPSVLDDELRVLRGWRVGGGFYSSGIEKKKKNTTFAACLAGVGGGGGGAVNAGPGMKLVGTGSDEVGSFGLDVVCSFDILVVLKKQYYEGR